MKRISRADVAALVVALGHRGQAPVDIDADGTEQLPAQDGHLGHIDAVGTEEGTAPADGALVQVVEPFLDDVLGEVPGPGHFPQDPPDLLEIAAVDRPQELGPQHRHVLGVAGAQEEMALVGAGPAPDADIKKELQGTEPFQPVFDPLENDFLPVLGQSPVLIGYRPFPGIGVFDPFHPLDAGGIAIDTLFQSRFHFHPALIGRLMAGREYLCWCGKFGHKLIAPFPPGARLRSWVP
jgi:hypothetical protein